MATSDERKTRKSDYNNLRTILLDELDRIMASEDCDIHRAFVLETARVFSSTASGFSLTDGRNEWGIDFCRSDLPIFTIAQCKCPERDFFEDEGRPKQYDRDALEDLLTGINYIRDVEHSYPETCLELKQFKSTYHESAREWKKETGLQAALGVLGELTPQANNYLRNQKNKLESEGIELLLWDWEKFFELLTTPQIDIENMKFVFKLDEPGKELLKRPNPVCFVRGFDLYQAWNQYQWNLVDWNVRAEIKNSPTNKRIQDTLLTPSGRRHFQDYNNGLLIVCRQVSYHDLPEKKIEITLRQPQVVNGCQTLLSLVRAYLDLPEKDQEDFEKNVRVQIKIISNQTQDFVEKIIQSTNDQNPMSPRSLKSNTLEQKKLQESFGRSFIKYFYERKDGQFDGLLNFGERTPSFRPREYQIAPPRKKFRILDNEDLAYEWLAFIGFSHETLRGGLHLFDNDDLYRKAFLAHPHKKFWEAIKKTPGISPPVQSDDFFEDGSPSVSQYLLAHMIANIVNKRRVSHRKNREAAIERLSERGLIRVDRYGNPIDEVLVVESNLLKDDKYFLGIVINNMQDVIIELYSMILCLKYGPLEDQICRDILKYPPIRSHVENPYAEIGEDAKKAESRHILNLIYEFIRFSLELLVVKYGEVIRAQPRLKSYLAQRTTVDMLRAFLLEVNQEKIPNWPDTWCPGKGSFLDELPNAKDLG